MKRSKTPFSDFFKIHKSNITVNMRKRVITLRNQITPMTAVTLLMWLEIFESLSLFQPITLVIDSCRGGDWVAAKHMYASLKHARPPVICIAKKFVHSAAIAVFAGADQRLAYKGTLFQFHTAESSRKTGIGSRGNLVNPKAIKDRETASLHAQLSREVSMADEEFYEILMEGFGFPHSYLARMFCEKEYVFLIEDTVAGEIAHFEIVHGVIFQDKKRETPKKKY